jgi:hypothetical protein
VFRRWIPEIHYYQPHTPRLLLGTKADLRQDRLTECVNREEIDRLVQYYTFMGYLEVSAKDSPNEVQATVPPFIYDHYALKGPGYTYGWEWTHKEKFNKLKPVKIPVIIPPIIPPRDICLINMTHLIDASKFTVTDEHMDLILKLKTLFTRLFDVSNAAILILMSIQNNGEGDVTSPKRKGLSKNHSLSDSGSLFGLLPVDVVRYILVLFDARQPTRDSFAFPNNDLVSLVIAGQFQPLTVDFLLAYNSLMNELLFLQSKLSKNEMKTDRTGDNKSNCILQ